MENFGSMNKNFTPNCIQNQFIPNFYNQSAKFNNQMQNLNPQVPNFNFPNVVYPNVPQTQCQFVDKMYLNNNNIDLTNFYNYECNNYTNQINYPYKKGFQNKQSCESYENFKNFHQTD